MGCFYSQCPHSLHPPPFCHRTSLICEKHFNTTCPQTELTVWRHAHKDESTHIQRRGSHTGESKQITGSEERGNAHQTLTEPAPPLQRRETTSQTGGEQCRAINQRCSCQLIHRLCDHSFRSTGVCNPAGLSGRGWRGGCCPYLSTALQRNTSSPSNASLRAFTKFFNNSRPSTPSHPHCEKVLIEEKKKLQANSTVDTLVIYCRCTHTVAAMNKYVSWLFNRLNIWSIKRKEWKNIHQKFTLLLWKKHKHSITEC